QTPGGVVLASSTVDPITNATIAGNTGVLANGIRVTGAAPKVKNTILADDLGSGVAVCAGSITSLGHNLDSDDSCGLNGIGDLKNTDPGLSPKGLNDSGGGTNTWPPTNTLSPEIDTGDDKGCWITDQRFVTDPQDGNLDGTFHCDIGAYEFSASTINSDLAMTVTSSPNPVPKGSNVTFTINVSNKGPWSTIKTDIKLVLVTGVTYVSCSALGGKGGGSCMPKGQSVTITYPQGIDVTTPATATLVAAVSGSILVTSFSTTLTASSDNPDTLPNDNVVTVVVQVT
ncbi:MAG TPA: choice-of-anchor Q domain-containing protein, partial [Actinomycetota bacterium]